MIPVRIQRSRKKGFNLKEYSKSLNNLDVVYVGRGSKWGNPFRVVEMNDKWSIKTDGTDYCNNILIKNGSFIYNSKEEAVLHAIKFYEIYLLPYKHGQSLMEFYQSMSELEDISKLKGKNLSCWCPIKEGEKYHNCHADFLLSIANNIDINKIIENNKK